MPIAIEPAQQPDVEVLLHHGDEFASSLYVDEECFMLPASALAQSNTTVFVAREGGEALGMAALVDHGDGSGELKRMFVEERGRGRGIAGELLTAVENAGRDAGLGVIRLETGNQSTAALALYEKHGYRHIPPFGEYVGSASSVCMEKTL